MTRLHETMAQQRKHEETLKKTKESRLAKRELRFDNYYFTSHMDMTTRSNAHVIGGMIRESLEECKNGSQTMPNYRHHPLETFHDSLNQRIDEENEGHTLTSIDIANSQRDENNNKPQNLVTRFIAHLEFKTSDDEL